MCNKKEEILLADKRLNHIMLKIINVDNELV